MRQDPAGGESLMSFDPNITRDSMKKWKNMNMDGKQKMKSSQKQLGKLRFVKMLHNRLDLWSDLTGLLVIVSVFLDIVFD